MLDPVGGHLEGQEERVGNRQDACHDRTVQEEEVYSGMRWNILQLPCQVRTRLEKGKRGSVSSTVDSELGFKESFTCTTIKVVD